MKGGEKYNKDKVSLCSKVAVWRRGQSFIMNLPNKQTYNWKVGAGYHIHMLSVSLIVAGHPSPNPGKNATKNKNND